MTPEEYFEKYIPLVHRIFHREFANHMDHREDLIQEGYMALWKACTGFDESLDIKFITYAYRSIKNNMLNYIERFIHKYPVQSLETPVLEGSSLSLEDMLFEEKGTFAEDLVSLSLENLPLEDSHRVSLIIQGYTQNEISEMLGVSQSSISRSLQRFKSEVIKEMENNI